MPGEKDALQVTVARQLRLFDTCFIVERNAKLYLLWPRSVDERSCGFSHRLSLQLWLDLVKLELCVGY